MKEKNHNISKKEDKKVKYLEYDEQKVENEIDELLKLINSEKQRMIAEQITEITTTEPLEREKEGKTINNLKFEQYIGKHKRQLKFSRTEEIRTEIKKGSECVLTIIETNIKNKNCKIKEINQNSITIIIEEKIGTFDKNKLAQIDFIINETTLHRWENNLKNLNEKGKKALKLKLRIIAPEKSNFNQPIEFINKKLNEYQKESVKNSINSGDFFLIHGPFGTGKTTTIVELILQEIKLNHKVLVTAESNVAIDHILKKLEDHNKINKTRVGDLNKIPIKLKKYTIGHKIKNHPLYNNNMDYKEKLEIEREILRSSQVILATNSTAAKKNLKDIDFDIAIIDEASQATIPSVLIPISKAEKFILIGDHKQLPPVILNNDCQSLKKSLFEELLEKYPKQSQELLMQYRMNKILMEFPNQKFYDNKLKCCEKSENKYLTTRVLKKNDSSSPLIFLDTSKHNNKEEQLDGSDSYRNKFEANIAVEVAQMFLEQNVNKENIGIITTYTDQVRLIEEKTDVEVKTADGFQGSEKDIIIISMVRSNNNKNIGFLEDMKRLNVSLTRAKKKLIIIGNRETLENSEIYNEFIEFCENIISIKEYKA